MNHLKQYLKKTYLTSALYYLFKNRNDEKYKDYVMKAGRYLSVTFENSDMRVGDSKVHYIIENEWNTNGFFAILRCVLDACAVADLCGFIPYVNIVDSLYNVRGGFGGTNNMFEYYFKQIDQKPYELIKEKCNYVVMDKMHKKWVEHSFGHVGDHEYYCSPDYIMYMGYIFSKYFIIKDDLLKEFREDSNKVLSGEKTIGLHYRGTGWNNHLYGHPNPIQIEQCVEEINKYLKTGNYRIFVATDNEMILDKLRTLFGDRVSFYSDVVRSIDGSEIQLKSSDRKNNGYYLGKEVLRDAYTLSHCDVLVAGFSQVSLFAQIQKTSRNEKYDSVSIIDNGICMKKSRIGKKYRKAINDKAHKIINNNR